MLRSIYPPISQFWLVEDATENVVRKHDSFAANNSKVESPSFRAGLSETEQEEQERNRILSVLDRSTVPCRRVFSFELRYLEVIESTSSGRLSSLIIRLDLIRLHDSPCRCLRCRFKGSSAYRAAYTQFPDVSFPARNCRYPSFQSQRIHGPALFKNCDIKFGDTRCYREGPQDLPKGNAVRCLPSAACRLGPSGNQTHRGDPVYRCPKTPSLPLFFEHCNSRGSCRSKLTRPSTIRISGCFVEQLGHFALCTRDLSIRSCTT